MSHYMKRDERYKLEAYLQAGKKAPWIARELGCCKQTIYNEIKRGAYQAIKEVHGIQRDVTLYSADKGQQIHDRNQTAKGRPIKLGKRHDYAKFLEQKIRGIQPDGRADHRQRYSPAAALAAARAAGYDISISVNTLYRYIDQGVFLHLSNKDLMEKSKRKKRTYNKVRRLAHPQLPSINDRPQAASDRAEPGHKEMDLVVGKSKTAGAVLTLVDRQTRMPMSFKLPDKKASSVRAVFDRLERRMGKRRFREEFKSITTDNGSEFLEFERLRESVFGGVRFDVYYCHSYSAWEKGSNENYNRMLRRFFPKGTDFSKVSQREIREAVDWIAHYPRKILGWKCSADLDCNTE